MVEVRVSAVKDFAELGERWRDLEQRAAGSFFQSWSWVGCLAAERYSDPVLVEARTDGRTVALGLFNRIRRWFGPPTLYLGETGSPEFDSPYVEQNGILTEAAHQSELTTLCLRRLAATHDLVLSGVGEPVAASVRRAIRLTRVTRCQGSWFVDLAAIRSSGRDYLMGLSANTRQQIRRSDRFFAATAPIVLTHAGSLGVAHTELDRMAELHQTSWQARGQAGSFASPFFRRFHHALVEAAFPRQEIAVMTISSGETIIGILYNFLWRRRVLAYQSGFAYRHDESRAKPGITCHVAAIRDALGQDYDVYDFLAGDDRYKRSLADQSHAQLWIEGGPVWSVRNLPRAAIGYLR